MPEVVKPAWPAPPGVHAFTTTRTGGVSEANWRSMNLGDHCGDRPEAVLRNRRRLAKLVPEDPPWLNQVHGNRVVAHGGDAAARREADGIFSMAPRQVCAVLTADCLPVLFCDRRGRRVAAAHAGWRGLAAGILEAAVTAMDTDPANILAWLGPGIGARAYEVGGEIRAVFTASDSRAEDAFLPRGSRWLADLHLLAKQRLAACGVRRVHGGDFCTYTEAERFFSHRRDGVTGRMATVIWRE